MRSFRFESVLLLSRKEGRARQVNFHANRNLILGRNHTGKSSLIKAIFLTLGARPTGELANWDESTISLVSFAFAGRTYRALHQLGHRALFADTGELLFATGSHAEWSEGFANLLEFNLVVTNKDSVAVRADPRCFFLPFYINQDGSWQGPWDTYVGLQQYRAPVTSILEYFAGIKPPEFYAVDSQRTQLQRILEELQKEQQFLGRARERFLKSATFSGPKLRPENFESEIDRLTRTVTDLNQRQESIRNTVVREEEALTSIELQIRAANEALVTYNRDASFLQTDPSVTLTCPTCGAEHAKSFIHLLGYAEEARVLQELVFSLSKDAEKVSAQHQQSRARLAELSQVYASVSDALNVRRGELNFGEVVESMGAERAFEAFEEEEKNLQTQIGEKLETIETLTQRLKELSDRERAREITRVFRDAYALALVQLNMPARDMKAVKLSSRPKVSGSGGPRSLLAYYGALWRTCLGAHGSFSIPLVVDSPNQQGQDDINLPKVLEFLANDLPSGAQVVVGSEIETEEAFDNVVHLDQPYNLLRVEDYASASEVINPLVDAMYGLVSHRG